MLALFRVLSAALLCLAGCADTIEVGNASPDDDQRLARLVDDLEGRWVGQLTRTDGERPVPELVLVLTAGDSPRGGRFAFECQPECPTIGIGDGDNFPLAGEYQLLSLQTDGTVRAVMWGSPGLSPIDDISVMAEVALSADAQRLELELPVFGTVPFLLDESRDPSTASASGT